MRIQKLGLPNFLFVFVPLEFLLELTGGYPDIHSQAFTGQEQNSFVLCESTFNRPLCPYHFPERESDLGIFSNFLLMHFMNDLGIIIYPDIICLIG